MVGRLVDLSFKIDDLIIVSKQTSCMPNLQSFGDIENTTTERNETFSPSWSTLLGGMRVDWHPVNGFCGFLSSAKLSPEVEGKSLELL